MKVYEYKGFPNPLRVRIALAEKGLFDKVEFVNVDVMAGEQKTPEFLAKNPDGVVPVLELEDGTVLSESTAITEYLDHLNGDATLTGTNAKERGVIHMMQRKVENGLIDAIGAYFHIGTPGLGATEPVQNEAWGKYRLETAIKTMHWIDRQLEGKDYLVADRFTVADITAFAGLGFADFLKIETPAECTNLLAWKERVASRASFAVATA